MAETLNVKDDAKRAKKASPQVRADAPDFLLHLDTDVNSQEDFPAVNVPGSDGLRFEDVRSALTEFVKHKNLLGLDVEQYNPDKDPDGSGANKLVELLFEVLTARLQAFETPAPEPAPAAT